jgi:hypothetical protein
MVMASMNSASVHAPNPIGRDVRRQKFAERRFNGSPARVVMAAAGQRVTGGAIADDREVPAAFDLLEILLVDASGRSAAPRGSEGDAEKDALRNATHAPVAPDF